MLASQARLGEARVDFTFFYPTSPKMCSSTTELGILAVFCFVIRKKKKGGLGLRSCVGAVCGKAVALAIVRHS